MTSVPENQDTSLHGQDRLNATQRAFERNQEYIEKQNGLGISAHLVRLSQFVSESPAIVIKSINTWQTNPPPTEELSKLSQRLSQAAKKIALQHDPYKPLTFAEFQHKSEDFGLTTQDISALREYIVMDREANRSKKRSVEAQNASETDSLTGLLNRKGFDRRIIETIAHSKRANEPLSIAYIDADQLKFVNDTFSHQAGDILLRRMAEILQIRESDIVCRVGGDEFVIILPNTNINQSVENGQTIKDLLAQRLRGIATDKSLTFTTQDGKPHTQLVEFSVGFATLEENDTTTTLIERAEEQMKKDKQERKTNHPSLHIRD